MNETSTHLPFLCGNAIVVGTLVCDFVMHARGGNNISSFDSCSNQAIEIQKILNQMASVAHTARKSWAMGPSVRNLLNHYQLDPSKITSTGPHQTMLKSDVLHYINHNRLKPADGPSSHHGQSTQQAKSKTFTPNLDISGYQPRPGPEGFSKQAKKLLDM